MAFVLSQQGWKAGKYTLGFQACDDATPQTGAWDSAKCTANATAYASDKSVIGVPWRYSATNHDGIQPGDLYFYRWELQPNSKFKLAFLGTVTDVVAGKVSL